MFCMLVTAETSHAERSWLKAAAPENMPDMEVTPETFHWPMVAFGENTGQRPSVDSSRQTLIALSSATLSVKAGAHGPNRGAARAWRGAPTKVGAQSPARSSARSAQWGAWPRRRGAGRVEELAVASSSRDSLKPMGYLQGAGCP
eukprot:scaffold20904_cov95-Isochrysis_galbana.AAC.1